MTEFSPGRSLDSTVPRFVQFALLSLILTGGVILGCTPDQHRHVTENLVTPEALSPEIKKEQTSYTNPVQHPSNSSRSVSVQEGSTFGNATPEHSKKQVHFSPGVFSTVVEQTAGETLSLTVKDAVLLSLGENERIRLMAMEPRIGNTRPEQALGEFDPVPYIQGTETQSRTPAGSSLVGQEETVTRGRLGIRGMHITGITYDLFTELERSSSDNPFRLTNPQYRGRLELQIQKDLLDGFTPESNLAEYHSAVKEVQSKVENFRSVINEQIHLVQTAYWDYVGAIRQQEEANSQLEFARDTVEVTRSRVEAKKVADVELLEARAKRSEVKERVIFTENQTRNKRDRLLQFIAPPDVDTTGWNVDIQPVSTPAIQGTSFNEKKLIEEAFQFRPEIHSLKKRIQASKRRQEQLQEDVRPDLDLNVSYSLQSLEESRSRGFDQIPRGGYYDWTMGLKFSFPIGNRTARARLRRERLKQRRLKLQKDRRKTEIARDVRKALRELNSSRARIQAAEDTVELSKKQLEAEQTRQGLGLTTTHKVLEIKTELVEARMRLIQAKADFMKALSNVKKSTGRLVKKYGEHFGL